MRERVRQRVRGWLAQMEPWYLAYALLGAATGGLIAIFLPLGVERLGTAAHVGLVMAALSAGHFTGGIWGTLADRMRLHRALFIGGACTVVLAFIGFALVSHVGAWFVFALILGSGTASANIVANLFIVETHPKEEWHGRISWLQTAYSGGVVVGLLLASPLSHLPMHVALLTGAVITGIAVILGWRTTQTPPHPVTPRPAIDLPPRVPEWVHSAPERVYHALTWQHVRRLGPTLRTPFGFFLGAWLLASLGVTALAAVYPLLMRDVFSLSPSTSSLVKAVAAGFALGVYAPAGLLVARLGGIRVLRTGLIVRAVALGAVAAMGIAAVADRSLLVLPAIAGYVLAGPLMGVSSSLITSRLSETHEGSGTGMFHATTALGGLAGALMGGWVAYHWGYDYTAMLAAGGVGIGLILVAALPIAPRPQQAAAPQSVPKPS